MAPSQDLLTAGKVLVVGLGNPGPKYELTRHNIGFMVLDRVAERSTISVSREKFKGMMGTGFGCGRPLVCLKPQTFMNLSGQAVAHAVQFFDVPVGAMVVFHDDVDLPFGKVRVKVGGGHGGHNGLRNIDKLLGRKDYFRVRVGVGRPERGEVSDYVLSRFSDAEFAELSNVLDHAADTFEDLLDEGLKHAQNLNHGGAPGVSRRPKSPSRGG